MNLNTSPRKVYEVMVYDKLYDVWQLEGKDHAGQERDGKSNYWVYLSDRLPDGIAPPIDSPHWKPFHNDSWFPRHCWDIRISQKTTTKTKWDELRFSNHTNVEMRCNGKLFFSFGTSGGDSGLHFAWNKAMYMLTILSEHPFNFYNPTEENGRLIWWYNLPAIVETRDNMGWEINIRPDYVAYGESQGIPPEKVVDAWIEEYVRRKTKTGEKPDPSSNFQEVDKMYDDESMRELRETGRIRWGDAYSDQHINWFRK